MSPTSITDTLAVHVAGRGEAEFVQLREMRDRIPPRFDFVLESLRIDLRGKRLPEPERNGRRTLKIPLVALPGAV